MVMMTESVAILAITLCMVFLFVRSKHADYAVSIFPILLVPATHMAAFLLTQASGHMLLNMPYQMVVAFADMAALAVSCALFAVFSNKIKRTRTKCLYLVLLIGYSVALTCAYVYQTIGPLRVAYLQNLTR